MDALSTLTAAGADSGDGATVLAIAAVVAVVSWLASLKLHPFTNCPRCRGAAKHHGDVFTHAYRACRGCGGTGRRLRFGARIFGSNRRPPTGRS
jgi:hypothetical protein